MEHYIRQKIDDLKREHAHLKELERNAEDLMISGLILQELKRNEGLVTIYDAILDQYGWKTPSLT
ncbi:hypothetical protein [Falsirhodobacter sp. 20TX0035]|uniref:hypothetical protein n=1 Tax=Falsirhodobacter sp. 20TX0035 TaxID=3022019 RepID=UPI00232FE0F8|nr:hypothetical protein [Falsirhodobacter sp. 20TX0035]MDB6452878.1 hypothetical protein [Falsirhodobacter sp. 20TX0035]